MIGAWILIISLIVALGGLAALLVQSSRGESLQHPKDHHLLPWPRKRHRRAQVASVFYKGRMSHTSMSAATGDAPAAWRKLLDGVQTQCGMAPDPGERLRIWGADGVAIYRLGKINIGSVRAVLERLKQ